MGQILDQWLAKNSERLSAAAGRPPPGMPAQAFGPPEAGPAQPGFPQGAARGAGPGFPMDAAMPGSAPQPGFAPSAPVAAPVEVRQPAKPKQMKAQPRGKKGTTFADVYKDADPKSISKAIDLLEKTTGKSVNELYQQQTGHPPPRGTKREKIAEFLLEFGLNLMAQPAGQDSFSSVGRSAQTALATGRQRDVEYEARHLAAKERQIGRMDKAFDRAEVVERLDLERQKVQAEIDKPTGTFDNYIGDDGYMYTYNEQSGEGRRVMVSGKAVKPDPKLNKSAQQRFDTEVRFNLYMSVHGKDAEGAPLTGTPLTTAKKGALRFANREREYTRDEARRDAVKQATIVLSKLPDYTFATPEEQKTMLEEKVEEYTELLMYGSGPPGGQPDLSRLSEGVATPVTNESGVTEYWTIKEGRATKVSENELAPR